MLELKVDRLTKQFKNKTAVDRLSVCLTEGIYGLLGANGAGKTTLMRLLCDIQKPTSGEILCNDKPISDMGAAYRRLLGYLPQHFGYYPDFTAYKFMMYIASLKGLSASHAHIKTLELLDFIGLLDEKDRKIKTYSGGMKQRLGIAQAMLNDPKILIVDEPTAGLDPKERMRFRNLISSFSKDKIIILSTHIVSDIEYIADEILLMKKGTLLHKGKAEDITRQIDGCVWECEVEKKTADHLNSTFAVSSLKSKEDKVLLRIVSKEKPLENAINVQPSLEDLYLFYFNEGVDIV